VRAHGAVASKVLSRELVENVLADWLVAPISDKLRAMLGFLEKLTLTPEQIGVGDIAPLHAAGISDQAIEDAIYVCAYFHCINRIADALDVYVPTTEMFAMSAERLLMDGYHRKKPGVSDAPPLK
jgi:uncharacterized peroxidase-related enzyme